MTKKPWMLLGGGLVLAMVLWILIAPSLQPSEPWLPVAFSGAVVVAKDDQVLFQGANGYADRGIKKKLKGDSTFLIGPLTQQFTAVLALQMVEEGKLSLDGRVVDYLPDYPPEAGALLTLHHLLSHTSGLPQDLILEVPADPEEAASSSSPSRVGRTTPSQMVAAIGGLELLAEPGQSYLASDPGYVLVGAILESVSGQSFSELLEEKIVQPLGLEATGYQIAEEEIPGLAQDYLFDGVDNGDSSRFVGTGMVQKAPAQDLSRAYSARGMYSTLKDLLRWHRALYSRGEQPERGLLSEAMTEKLFSPNLRGFGYGVFRNPETTFRLDPEAPLFYGGGDMAGYHSFAGQYDDGTTVIVLSNVLSSGIKFLIRDFHLRANGLKEVSTALASPRLGSWKQFEADGGIKAFEAFQSDLSLRAGYEIRPSANSVIRVTRMLLQNRRFNQAEEFLEKNLHVDLERDEGGFNGLGYTLLRRDKTNLAIRVFEHNTRANPSAPNTYDSLGEALETHGDLKSAHANYQRAVDLAQGTKDRRLGAFRDNLERTTRRLGFEGNSPEEDSSRKDSL